MSAKIHERETEIPESLNSRCAAIRKKVRMDALLIDSLEKRSRKLNAAINAKLNRLRLASIARRGDDQTKREIFEMLSNGRSDRQRDAQIRAFLSRFDSKQGQVGAAVA